MKPKVYASQTPGMSRTEVLLPEKIESCPWYFADLGWFGLRLVLFLSKRLNFLWSTGGLETF
jgi:hypothetical protein